MKTIVVFESKTGFTALYAQWIADELHCECKPLKHVNAKSLAGYECVIFGGWIMGNTIRGLEKMPAMYCTPKAIFAVGATPPTDFVMEMIKTTNRYITAPLFYMEGGLRIEKLNFGTKLMLKALQKSCANKPQKNEQERFMAEHIDGSFDHSGKEQIAPLIEHIRELSL